MLYCAIMAGGVGERFWPRSRKLTPKQLLKITTEECLLAETIKRMLPIISLDRIRIITNKEQGDLILQAIPMLKKENIIAEPFGMNTAPCIALGVGMMDMAKDDDTMVVLPADHIIHDINAFNEQILKCEEYCLKKQCLLTIGIKPNEPSTGYGYINIGEKEQDEFSKVKRFVEKPNYDTAVKYLDSGQYYWNSGMFMWSFKTIKEEFKKYMPDLYQGINNISSANSSNKDKVILDIYKTTEKISIDYGIMEKSQVVHVVPANFDWDDLGAWDAYQRHVKTDNDKNVCEGKNILIDAKDNIILSKEKLIALIGIDNLIVVEADDAIMICPKDRVQDVKKIVQEIKDANWNQYL